ncbi:glycoside hydrolase family 2 protein [Bifidobacterium choloepi]|uniref:Glycoside hydrolase family 2 n=1 Tax=Bifidobacterium choloepi TaxID=2614131 RepID=A0A6I5NAW7_9BIFI|nr:sugar-binding domain-containing protein [Bifidobacterium choloepi]NEG69590.1 glycoside hydrolase family 2 [Bifidobacterium choloepi]
MTTTQAAAAPTIPPEIAERLKYPNPQCVRTNWVNLDGQWDFHIPPASATLPEHPGNNALDTDPATLAAADSVEFPEFDRTITVPYSYTFPKSGVSEDAYHPVVWYRRSFGLAVRPGKRYLLHFEAVDYACDVWINGHHVGSHRGGMTPFAFDVTPYLTASASGAVNASDDSSAKSSNEIVVKVVDFNRPDQPLGKQSWKDTNFACWYTRTIGIWQSVWIEEAGETYLESFTMTPHASDYRLSVDAAINNLKPAQLRYTVTFHGQPVTSGSVMCTGGRARFDIPMMDLSSPTGVWMWSPDMPFLYDVTFDVVVDGETTDSVSSYFGMRDISVDNGLVFLNDQKTYLKLVLNQGYYPDGGMTGTPDEFAADIATLKAMGFNGNRIHQKIEDHRMLYLCDALGFLATAEFPSGYEFGPALVDNIQRELPAYFAKHVNHPSVFAYVLMNESWGTMDIVHSKQQQDFVDSLYWQARAYDPSRLAIGNDGFEQVKTDLCTIHDYNDNAASLTAIYKGHEQDVKDGAPSPMSGRRSFCPGYSHQDVPFLMTEYGGVAYEPNGQRADSWGYGPRMASGDQVLAEIKALTEAVMTIDYCVGFCYTQATDVEQEVNGLMNHNHQPKFTPAQIHSIMDASHSVGYVTD